MKKLLPILSVSFAFWVSAFMWGCSDNNSVESDGQGDPVITSLLPAMGSPGIAVTIEGKHFTATLEEVQVKFNDQEAQVVSVASSSIKVKAPYVAPGTKANVTVVINGIVSNAQSFTYTDAHPVISALSQVEGSAGESLTITGSDFGEDTTYTMVNFGEKRAVISSLSSTSIEVVIPDGEEGEEVDVFVTTSGMESNKISFTYSSPLPVIASMSQTQGVFGDEITISGQYFSPNVEQNKVVFREAGNQSNEVEATIISASETELKVTAPYLYKEQVEVCVIRNGNYISAPEPFQYDLFACDSTSIVKAEWQKEQLRSDVEWRNAAFNAFGYENKQHINVVAITPGAGGVNTQIGVAIKEDGQCQSVSRFGESLDALAAINAGFFIYLNDQYEQYYGTDQMSLDHIRINNQVAIMGRARPNGWPAIPEFIDACMAFNSNSTSNPGYDVVFWELALNKTRNTVQSYEFAAGINPARAQGGYDFAITAGPRIISAGKQIIRTGDYNSHWDSHRPRTLIGVDADGVIYMVTLDGDNSAGNYEGITINNASDIMRTLGCIDAMCFDGGGSTTMWVKGKGKVSDVTASSYERPVANVFYVK